jgi:hypothetical protein
MFTYVFWLNYQRISAKISGTELAAASIRCAGPRPKAVEKAGSNKARPQVRLETTGFCTG